MANDKEGAPRPAPPTIEKKSRQFALISYLDESVIRYVIERKSRRIRHWAFILHDKDFKEDGSPKEAHYHVLLWLVNPMTVSAVRGWFSVPGVEANTLGQIVKSGSDIVEYMTHEGNPEKFQYCRNDVVSDCWEWFLSKSDDSPSMQCLDDLMSGMSLYQLSRIYGREFIINHQKYIELARLIAAERGSHESKNI